MALNMFVAMGRLTRDPEDKSNENKAIARFTLAVDRWKKDDPADFFDCTAFGSTAEAVLGKKQNCSPLKKGDKIIVHGSVHVENFTDKEGVKRKNVNVTLDGFDYCESKNAKAQAPDQTVQPQGYMPQQGYVPQGYAPQGYAPQAQQPVNYGQPAPAQQPIPAQQPVNYGQPAPAQAPAPAGQPPVGSLNLSTGANGFIPNGQYQ